MSVCMSPYLQKSTGSYYTCQEIACYISEWAISVPEANTLEPSFGDGVFLDAALNRYKELGNTHPKLVGVEMQSAICREYASKHANVQCMSLDFLCYNTNERYDAIIGNPPYVSLRTLDLNSKNIAMDVALNSGVKMQTSSSLWMPFVIHATSFLNTGGKLGFVLPYELTYVRYSFPLWDFLAKNYGCLTICRVLCDFFPDVDVETVVFLASKKGSTTTEVFYKTYSTVSDMINERPMHISTVLISAIKGMKKPFERDLIPQNLRDTLAQLRSSGILTEISHTCKFKIGYVSGNKTFFNPSSEVVAEYNIKSQNLRHSLLNAKQLSSDNITGLATSTILNPANLFYPVTPGLGENNYIEYGVSIGVNKGYKCKLRNPWYIVPGLEVPNVVLTVFGDIPKLFLNDGNYYISNSLLGGFSNHSNGKEIICRWYNSLTLLSIEATIHSLGGGTLVCIPGEADKLEILSNFPVDRVDEIYEKMAEYLKHYSISDLYLYGDEIVLKKIYYLPDNTIAEIRRAYQTLRMWRIPAGRRTGPRGLVPGRKCASF